jgi:YebC/PmpR family DNA-binding regulatory protein
MLQLVGMSGHSKWSNIKRKKEANDSKKGKEFSKLSRLISVAVKKGGGDVNSNPSLRLAVEKAKKAKMPKDTIDKAILKGSGADGGASFEEAIYEGFGPGGVAYLIYALTDSTNRTVAELKNIFSKSGGSLGAPGCTSYLFDATTKEPSYLSGVDDSNKEKNLKLLEHLEDNDDVQEIYSNI